MSVGEAISMWLIILGLFLAYLSIGVLFYIGKTRVKAVDKAVLGFELYHDSLFSLMNRVPNYAGGFMWKWSARRGKLEGKIEHFDAKFRRPFIIFMVLVTAATILLITGSILQEIFDTV